MNVGVWLPLAGGGLIGIAASLLLLFSRETAGISGIIAGLFRPNSGGRLWRATFVAGLLTGGLLLVMLLPGALGATDRPIGAVVVAGLLVGFGTRLSGGCTSGHGVCGLSRLSVPSMVAVATFMAAGILTVLALRLASGGSW